MKRKILALLGAMTIVASVSAAKVLDDYYFVGCDSHAYETQGAAKVTVYNITEDKAYSFRIRYKDDNGLIKDKWVHLEPGKTTSPGENFRFIAFKLTPKYKTNIYLDGFAVAENVCYYRIWLVVQPVRVYLWDDTIYITTDKTTADDIKNY